MTRLRFNAHRSSIHWTEKPLRAFTLIELLIVVAIISLLAAIAVVNFLEAQTRAKISRVKSDQRTIVTALESYAVDWNNNYPPHKREDDSEINYPDRYVPLTTPASYITSLSSMFDVFLRESISGTGGSEIWYSWTNFSSFQPPHALLAVKGTQRWLLRSRGPDGLNEENSVRNAYLTLGLAAAPSMIYDATNGTISRGDIFRTAMENH